MTQDEVLTPAVSYNESPGLEPSPSGSRFHHAGLYPSNAGESVPASSKHKLDGPVPRGTCPL